MHDDDWGPNTYQSSEKMVYKLQEPTLACLVQCSNYTWYSPDIQTEDPLLLCYWAFHEAENESFSICRTKSAVAEGYLEESIQKQCKMVKPPLLKPVILQNTTKIIALTFLRPSLMLSDSTNLYNCTIIPYTLIFSFKCTMHKFLGRLVFAKHLSTCVFETKLKLIWF